MKPLSTHAAFVLLLGSATSCPGGGGQSSATDGTTDTSSTTVPSSTTAGCPVGSPGCPCTPGGSCDPGLECTDDVCQDPQCPVGGKGCPCTGGGACDVGLECVADYCVDPEGTEGCPPGMQGCPCEAGGMCEAGLECVSDFCVDAGGTTGDPTTSTTTGISTSTSGTTTAGDDCGNGEIEQGEDCDDGDMINGNGCNNDCTPSGTELWTQTYDNPENLDDSGQDVAVDSNDNILVSGFETVGGQGRNIIVRKYQPSGQITWSRTYNGSGNGNDNGYGVAVDSQDNVIVTGEDVTQTQGDNIWVRKYNSSGQVQWTQSYNNINEFGFGVATDADDNIIVVGDAQFAGESWNVFLRKYQPDGATIWSDIFDGGMQVVDAGRGVATDTGQNVIISGWFGSGNTVQKYVRKYSPNGSELWTRLIVNEGSPMEAAATNEQNDIFVVGRNGAAAAWLRKYNSIGNDQWDQTYKPELGAGGQDVAVDSAGAIVWCGGYGTNNQGSNAFVRKHGPNGQLYWSRTHDGPVSQDDGCSGVAVDSEDNVIVVGSETTESEGRNMWIRKYSP